MSRNYLGSGMMVGLALLTGCSPALHRPDFPEVTLPRVEPLSPPPEVSQRPADLANLRAFAPPPSSPPVPAVLAASPQMPEAFGVRVAARQSPPSPRPRWRAPTQARATPLRIPTVADELVPTPPTPLAAPPAPEVVLLGVGDEKAQGLTQASWVAPASPVALAPGGDRGEAPQVVPPQTHRPPSTPMPAQDQSYGHAADYGWLMGELEYLRSKNVWRLRYAPADQEDRHGGTVLLVADSLPADCKSGQVVRVEGQLINPESDEPRPPYWVRTLQVLKAAPAVEE